MSGTQAISTTNYPAFITSTGERESTVTFGRKQHPEVRMTEIRGFEFNPREIVISSESLGWQQIKALLVRHTGTELIAASLQHHCLVLQLGDPIEIEVWVEGRSFRRTLQTGEIIILPAGPAVRLQWREARSNETLYFFLDPAFLEGIAEDLDIAAGDISIEPVVGIADEQLRYLAMSLMCDMKDSNILGVFCAEQLGRALGLQIIRRYSHFAEVSLKQGGMAPFRLRKALEFINKNLGFEQSVSLDKVAGRVGMSYSHFCRMFKQSMGISANSYIVSRRIKKAKELLANSNSPIADIALQVGFASQSHFTTMFRRSTGTTPNIFRRTSFHGGLFPSQELAGEQ